MEDRPPSPTTHTLLGDDYSQWRTVKKKPNRFSGPSPKESDFVVLGGLWKSSEKHQSKWPSFKNLQIRNAGEGWRKGKPPTLLEGM